MIKLEHLVTASTEQLEFIIEGMRNPMNSWDKSDTYDEENYMYRYDEDDNIILGENDHNLMTKLAKAGTDHRKFMRMMPVYVRITAPLYWWKEFDTYKVGTVANSCSTMHKIMAKEFDISDFSVENMPHPWIMDGIISELNKCRFHYLNFDKMDDNSKNAYRYTDKKDIWWQMIQLLPSSYNQTRNVMMNYEVLANIYKSRKDHKLDEWRGLCKWIETDIPYNELITGDKDEED